MIINTVQLYVGSPKFYTELWNLISIWVGQHILGFSDSINSQSTGSGDKMFNFASNFTVILLAIITAIIWSITDRNRVNYNTLLYWTEVLIRYYLAATLIGYGGAKIFKTQFPFPSLNRLMQPFGEASPMGLAWTYMGYSTTFNYFTGFGEAIAGFLLFFRQTKLIGVFIGIPVMLTILMMNISYDIPVKIFSGNLLFMLICLLIPDIKRLLNFFLLNKKVDPSINIVPNFKQSIRKLGLIVKYSFIGYLLYSNISSGLERQKKWGDKRVKPPLYGIYTAEEVIINNDTIAPLITNKNRWHYLIIDREKIANIKFMNGKTIYADFITDTLSNTIDLKLRNGTMEIPSRLNYQETAPNQLKIEGVLVSQAVDTIIVHLKKKNLDDFLLINRKFHWINEYPFNR